MTRRFSAVLASCLLLPWLLSLPATAREPPANSRFADLVDPFIGTDGTGHTFPGATLPFGMVAASPDNADRGWDYSSGYQYRAPRILGFSNTHISGAGIPELGDVLLQPASGAKWQESTQDFSASYDKSTEAARPGYYAVTLREHRVKVELTATQRVALHRYTFAETGVVQVLVDLAHGLNFVEAPRVQRSDTRINAVRGEIEGTVHSRNWVERQMSFVLVFDHAIKEQRLLPAGPEPQAPRYLLTFDLGRERVLEARIALSTVDAAGARANLQPVSGLTFDGARRAADREWNRMLGRITIDAPRTQQRIFYSALYHALLHPSDIADADGRVRGPTGDVFEARGGRYYSTLSLWDTFRAVHPLLTLVAPERVDGMIETLLEHQRAMGVLPLWTAWGRETWTMIGNPALPVIADAIAKGFQGFDRAQALAAMLATSTQPRVRAPAWAQLDWTLIDRYGYLPFDLVDGESVSKSLEAAIGDDAVARVARALGDAATAQKFAARAQSYRRLFDPATGVMRGRDSHGRWREPFDPLTPTSPLNNPGDYTEANAWQYTWTPALHDPAGLADLMGGNAGLGQQLDRYFSLQGRDPNAHLGQEAMIGQYAHGNEPSHHVAWLYAFTDHPETGYRLVARIARDFYQASPAGIIGNDDAGQMSAWYIFATLGFYPAQPASGNYVAGIPLVRRARIQVPGSRALIIERAGTGDQLVQLTLAGESQSTVAIPHSRLASGGTLRFTTAQVR